MIVIIQTYNTAKSVFKRDKNHIYVLLQSQNQLIIVWITIHDVMMTTNVSVIT